MPKVVVYVKQHQWDALAEAGIDPAGHVRSVVQASLSGSPSQQRAVAATGPRPVPGRIPPLSAEPKFKPDPKPGKR